MENDDAVDLSLRKWDGFYRIVAFITFYLAVGAIYFIIKDRFGVYILNNFIHHTMIFIVAHFAADHIFTALVGSCKRNWFSHDIRDLVSIPKHFTSTYSAF